jgi:hypothetical protein
MFHIDLYWVVKKRKLNSQMKKKNCCWKPTSTECYKALYEKDTINLKINNFKNGEVTGDLEMKIENMPTKLAKLWENLWWYIIASYTFIQGANEKTFKTQWLF